MSEPSALTQSPILPTFIRLRVPNIFAVVAMALVSIAETTYMGALGTAPFHTKAIWTRLSTGLCTGLCTD